MGKEKVPVVASKAAVPTTPGVRPRLVRASTKDASTATWVSTPLLRSGSDATGSVDAADDEDDGAADDDEVEPASLEEQAARLKMRAPEATMPKAHGDQPRAAHVPANVTWHPSVVQPVVAAVTETGRLPVSEFTLDRSGAASPFGDDVEFPLPVESLRYQPATKPDVSPEDE